MTARASAVLSLGVVLAMAVGAGAAPVVEITFEDYDLGAIEFKSDAYGTWGESGGNHFHVTEAQAREGVRSVQVNALGARVAPYAFNSTVQDALESQTLLIEYSLYRAGNNRFRVQLVDDQNNQLVELGLHRSSGGLALLASNRGETYVPITASNVWYDFTLTLDMASSQVLSATWAVAGDPPNELLTGGPDGFFRSATRLGGFLIDSPDGNNASLAFDAFSIIPEPATLFLLAAGVPLVLARRRAMSA